MKKVIAFLATVITIAGCAHEEHAKIRFVPPADVTYESKENPEFYSFHWGTNGETAVFIMSPHPAGLSSSMVREMADKTANQLEPQLKIIEGVESVSKKTADISVGQFSGREIDFRIMMKDGNTFHQCVYILWDGDRAWQGQLTGPKDSDIVMARKLLQTAQK